jgi:hypothetical protein
MKYVLRTEKDYDVEMVKLLMQLQVLQKGTRLSYL